MSATHALVVQHRAALSAHAATWYPRECCALIVRDAHGASRVILADNLADTYHAADPEAFPRTAETAYIMDPRLVIAAERAGEALVALVHSHCDVGAYFSAEDTRMAVLPGLGGPLYPGVDYVIIDQRADGWRGFKVFAWSDRACAYVEVA